MGRKREQEQEQAVPDNSRTGLSVEALKRSFLDNLLYMQGRRPHNSNGHDHYNANKGKGFAVRYGMVRAAGDLVLFSDADLATPIEEVEKLEAAMTSTSPRATRL